MKERTIKFAIDKVNEWRSIHKNGIISEDNKKIKLNLD